MNDFDRGIVERLGPIRRVPMIPATTRRVEHNTDDAINRERQAQVQASLRYHAARPHEIPARLDELNHECDIERALQANAAIAALAGLALMAVADRRFVAIPAMVVGFLMQHAIQGRCPPATLLRRLGFRTGAEIAEERCGLRMLDGEYRSFGYPAPVQWMGQAEEMHEAVEA
jgi:hypothetical protein